VFSAGGRWEASSPDQIALEPQRAAVESDFFLDKIRNILYVLVLAESLPARRLRGPGEESPRLFEMFVTTTAACEPGRRRIPYFLGRNPLKSPDSEK
jgi:hypothetical protein